MPDIKVTCRQCKRQANAHDFVLDHIYKMMVCPQCVRDRNSKEKKESSSITNKESIQTKKYNTYMDDDDEIIEKSYSQKMHAQPQPILTKPIGKVKVKCKKCAYIFNYDTDKKYPKMCPGCGMKIN